MKRTTKPRATAPIEKQIYDRYAKSCGDHGITPASYMDVWLTLDCVRRDNDLPKLDLQRLLDSEDFDFIHDIGGMLRHMDRSTGKLGGCFLPRCAR